MPVRRTRGPDRFPNRNRKPRKPRPAAIAAAAEMLMRSETAALIDKHTGKPNGERIIEALALLAMGKREDIKKFFGDSYKRMSPRDRQAALYVLEQRRFGKVPVLDEQTPDVRPVTIVNVYATSEDYKFVTDQRPKAVASSATPAALEAGREREK